MRAGPKICQRDARCVCVRVSARVRAWRELGSWTDTFADCYWRQNDEIFYPNARKGANNVYVIIQGDFYSLLKKEIIPILSNFKTWVFYVQKM